MQLLKFLFLTLAFTSFTQKSWSSSTYAALKEGYKLEPIYKVHAKNSPNKLLIITCATCSHCAHYYKQDLEEILGTFFKRLDQAPFSIQVIGLPTNKLSVKVEMIKWCMGKENYLKVSLFLYEKQDEWMPTSQELAQYAVEQDEEQKKNLFETMSQKSLERVKNLLLQEFKELTPAHLEKYWANDALQEAILANRKEIMEHFHLQGVPAFIWVKNSATQDTFPPLVTSKTEGAFSLVTKGIKDYFFKRDEPSKKDGPSKSYSIELPMGTVLEIKEQLEKEAHS
ncbi:MAG TPA: thioredoxin domain-containing protein [Alphaproteobacteria bacterium]|nr:thioredoxin domain-containing protein [Alphaproteobacteria bacterium]